MFHWMKKSIFTLLFITICFVYYSNTDICSFLRTGGGVERDSVSSLIFRYIAPKRHSKLLIQLMQQNFHFVIFLSSFSPNKTQQPPSSESIFIHVINNKSKKERTRRGRTQWIFHERKNTLSIYQILQFVHSSEFLQIPWGVKSMLSSAMNILGRWRDERGAGLDLDIHKKILKIPYVRSAA